MNTPTETYLHGWQPIVRKRNGDLVIPLSVGGSEQILLWAAPLAALEFAQAILAASRHSFTAKSDKLQRQRERRDSAKAPVAKPNGRIL